MDSPTVLTEGVVSDVTSFTTVEVTPQPGTLIMAVLAGNKPNVSAPPSEVSGLGLNWTLLRYGTSGNDRITVALWTATGEPVTGTVGVAYGSLQTDVAYRLLRLPGEAGQTSISIEAQDVDTTLTSPPDPMSGVLTVAGMNTRQVGDPGGGQGQVGLGQWIGFGSPEGSLHTMWQATATQAQTWATGTGTWTVAISVEVEVSQPKQSAAAYLVVDGVEVPVTTHLVQGGAEAPVTLEV